MYFQFFGRSFQLLNGKFVIPRNQTFFFFFFKKSLWNIWEVLQRDLISDWHDLIIRGKADPAGSAHGVKISIKYHLNKVDDLSRTSQTQKSRSVHWSVCVCVWVNLLDPGHWCDLKWSLNTFSSHFWIRLQSHSQSYVRTSKSFQGNIFKRERTTISTLKLFFLPSPLSESRLFIYTHPHTPFFCRSWARSLPQTASSTSSAETRGVRFHQHFMISFCARRSQKSKKR